MARYRKGDRVKVKAAAHPGMEMASTGSVEIVSVETAYGIKFDGKEEVHKWYLDSELEPADGRAGPPGGFRRGG